jgi:hypothetical protein
MIENLILRTKDQNIFTKEPEFAHVILSQDWDSWPCGTPLVIDGTCLRSERAENIRTFSLFPPRSYINKLEDIIVHRDCLVRTSLPPLAETHRTLTVEKFDNSRLERLRQYVKEMGGITFIVKEEKNRKKLIRTLKFFPRLFKYSSLFHYSRYGNKYLSGDDDELLGVISFFNLPYCVPLFNMKKVDGIGLSYCQAPRKISEKNNMLVRAFRVDMVLSNYLDNIFVIDGSDVNPMNPLQDESYSEIENWVGEELKVKRGLSDLKIAKERAKKQEAYLKVDDPQWGSATTTTTVYTGGSTSYYTGNTS